MYVVAADAGQRGDAYQDEGALVEAGPLPPDIIHRRCNPRAHDWLVARRGLAENGAHADFRLPNAEIG